MASLDRASSLVLMLWLASSTHALSAQQMPAPMEVELCDFRVPDAVAQANATFTMVFSAVRGPTGLPNEIKKVSGAFLDGAPFVACMKGWRIPGPTDEPVVVEFDWVHAKGWTAIRVLSKASSLKLRIAPGVCSSAYRRSPAQN